MIAQKCGSVDKLDGAFQARGLTDYGVVIAIWGAFWGMLL